MSGSITANRKRKRLERTLELISLLQAKHPIAFPAKGSLPVQPLRLDLAPAIVESFSADRLVVSRHEADRMLEYWESRKFYLKSFELASHRIDLDGTPVEALSDTDRNKALTRKLSIVAQRKISETP